MLIPKTTFRCERCWKYSPKIKCLECFPSPAFPLSCERWPPEKYEDRRRWDKWYVWRYLMELKEDPEAIYQIGSSDYEDFKYTVYLKESMSSYITTKCRTTSVTRKKNY